MSDSNACKKCFATVEESKVRDHQDWHRELDAKIEHAVKSGIAAAESRMVQSLRGRGLGGR